MMRWLIYPLLFAAANLAFAQSYTIRTYAGGALPVNVTATSANLLWPRGVALDSSGNVYIALRFRQIVVRVASNGNLTLVAGNGTSGFSGDGGAATSAQLSYPAGLAFDSSNNLYIADGGNNRIRRVATNGTITTVAGSGGFGFAGDGGPATSALLRKPEAVAVSSAGVLYIADSGNHRIRQVAGGTISTFAGNGTNGFAGDGGPATSASLASPSGVTVASAGDVFIADSGNHRIRRVSGGLISTFAGTGSPNFSDGSVATAALNSPADVDVDSAGAVYIADAGNHRIRRVLNGVVSTVAGSASSGFGGDGGNATDALLYSPNGIAVNSQGALYISDSENRRIRRVSGGIISTVAGDTSDVSFNGDLGPATSARLNNPRGLVIDPAGDLLIADVSSHRVRRVAGGVISTIAGTGIPGFSGDGGSPAIAQLANPEGVGIHSSGDIYIADWGYDRVRRISDGIISTFAGNGGYGYNGDNRSAITASLAAPVQVAFDTAGAVYIADRRNHRIRKVVNGTITTIAGTGSAGFSGDGGVASSAAINQPQSIAIDSAGNLYFTDSANHRVRRISLSTNIITTIAGNGTMGFSGDNGSAVSASMNMPVGVAVDSRGDVFISDTGNFRVRRVSGGVIQTIAGGGTTFGEQELATTAQLAAPTALTIHSGRVFVADADNNRIRVLEPIPVSIPSPNAPNALTGIPYSHTFSAAGGVGPYTWDVTSGNLPGGITLSTAGLLSGTPNAAGTFPFTLRVTDSRAGTASATISLVVTNCAPTFSPTSITLSNAAGSGSLAVFRNSACGQWTAVSGNTQWLTITSGSPGTGDGTVGYNALANPSGTSRSTTITVAGQSVPVTQGGVSCNPTISPNPVNVPPSGGTLSVAVVRNATCPAWTGTSNQAWLSVVTTTPITGNATIQLEAEANISTSPRSATLTIGGISFPVIQAGSACTAAFVTNSAPAPAAGGSGTVQYTLPSGCTNQPISSATDWLNATIASGTMTWTAGRNELSVGRTATITLAGANFTVSQAGAACTFNLTPLSRTITSGQNNGSFQIASPVGCSWTAVSDVPSWLHVQTPGTGSGTGDLAYVADANPLTTRRTGTITIGSRQFTVIQNGTAPSMACDVSADTMAMRRNGLTEHTGDVHLNCTGVPSAGVVTDVDLTFTSMVTSRVLNTDGTATEALAILNDATTPVLGTNAWQAGLAGPNAFRWKNVRITPNGQGSATLRLTNLRINSGTGSTTVEGLVELRSSTIIGLTNQSFVAGSVQDALTVNRGTVTAGPGSGQVTIPLIFQEQMAKGFLARSGESGYFHSNAPAGQADTGTRFRVRFIIPASVKIFAPVTSADGGFARLISNADSNGNGGTDTAGGGHVELVPAGSLATAIWEVKSPTDSLDSVTFPLIVEGATSTQIDELIAAMSAGFAPLSSAVAAVEGALTPRFADTSVFVPPVNLSIYPKKLTFASTAATASSKDSRLLAVASSIVANYDLHNGSSETAQTTVVRSSAPAGFQFDSSLVQATGASEVTYSSNMTEAKIQYVNFNPRDRKAITLGIRGVSETGEYIELLTTVESTDVDVDLSDNRASIGTTAENQCPPNTLTPSSATFRFGAGSGQFNIGSNCSSWKVQSNDDWVIITTAREGTGSFVVNYTVKENPTPDARETTITAAGRTFTVRQERNPNVGPCPYTLSSTSLLMAAAGETRRFFVTTRDGCPWNVKVDASFVQTAVEGGASASGNRALNVTASANPGAARSGRISIGDATITINQLAACPVTLSTSAITTGPDRLNRAVGVGSSCSWEVSANVPWMRALKAPSAITLFIDPNFAPRDRTGILAIGSQTLTVTQTASTATEGERIARLLFFELFGRSARADEIAANAVPLLADTAGTVTNLFNAGETALRSRYIVSLYRGLLRRNPEFTGWLLQRNNMADNDTKDPAGIRNAMIQSFLDSAEFKLNFGEPENPDFVRIIYRQVLGREASQAEVDFQVKVMGCTSRCQDKQIVFARDILLIPEAVRRVEGGAAALMMYHALLLKEGHPVDIEAIETALRGGKTLRDAIAEIVARDDFKALYK